MKKIRIAVMLVALLASVGCNTDGGSSQASSAPSQATSQSVAADTSKKLDFENVFGEVGEYDSPYRSGPLVIDGVEFRSVDTIFNFGPGFLPFTSDSLEFFTYGTGTTIRFPYPIRYLSFEAGQVTPSATDGRFKMVAGSYEQEFSGSYHFLSPVVANLPEPVSEVWITFLGGAGSDLGIDNLIYDIVDHPGQGQGNVCVPHQAYGTVSCVNDIPNSSSAVKSKTCNSAGTAYTYGSCTLSACVTGYHVSGNSCVRDAMACTPNRSYGDVSCVGDIEHSAVATKTKTCNSAGTDFIYGSCTATSCESGYSLSNNACVSQSGGKCTGRYNGTGGAYMVFNADSTVSMVNGSYSASGAYTQTGTSVTVNLNGNSMTGSFAPDCSSATIGGMTYPRQN